MLKLNIIKSALGKQKHVCARECERMMFQSHDHGEEALEMRPCHWADESDGK